MKNKETTLEESDITTNSVGRRSAIRSLSGAVLGAAALTGAGLVGSESVAKAQHSDPGGRGRHCSDSDPHDHGGSGRHCSDHD